MSWGHDEYIYTVMKDYLPEKALFLLRYHSFYAAHKENEYQYLMSKRDIEMMEGVVKQFNPFDLYTKKNEFCDATLLRPYYQNLIDEYFPDQIHW
jgi:inositol oxygenase